MEENKINFALTGLRLVIISLGVLLVAIIIGKSNGDESFVEGEANYGIYLDWMFFIFFTGVMEPAVAALGLGIYTFVLKWVMTFKLKMATRTGCSVSCLFGWLASFAFAVGTWIRG